MALEFLPRFRSADYMLDTINLKQGEHGAYWLLILNYYWSGGLPAERDEIYVLTLAATSEEKVATDRILAKYFHYENGRYVHHRIERELQKLAGILVNQSKAGKASAAARAKAAPKEHKGNGKAKPDKPEEPPLIAPDWLNVEKWNAWMAIRPAKARTSAAKRAALEKLESFRAAGHDGNEIIGNSLANGWQGLFPPDVKSPAGPMPLNKRHCNYCGAKAMGIVNGYTHCLAHLDAAMDHKPPHEITKEQHK